MKNSMKTIFFILSSLLLFLGANSVSAQTNFSGAWKRNDSQCDAGGLSMNSIPITVEIAQDQQTMLINTVANTKAGVIKSNDTLRIDGTNNTRITASGEKTQKGMQWSSDRQHFTETILITDGNGKEIQKWIRNYNLANEGKTLQISVNVVADGTVYQMEEFFDKQ